MTQPAVLARDGYRCVDCRRHRSELGPKERLIADHARGVMECDDPFDVDECETVCSTCSGRRDGSGRPRGVRRRTGLVVVCGAPGTGKTTLRRPLARRLRSASLGPDDFAGGWQPLLEELDRIGSRAVVECCQIPRGLRERMEEEPGVAVVVVELQASRDARRRRLHERDEREVDRLLELRPIAYEDVIRPDLVVDTTEMSPSEVVATVQAAIR